LRWWKKKERKRVWERDRISVEVEERGSGRESLCHNAGRAAPLSFDDEKALPSPPLASPLALRPL
jgi:hypothetical protein